METEQMKRFDNIDGSDWMTIPFERTAEGFLKGRAIVTSIGVFNYRRADGSIQRELRLPEEVFSTGTLDSLKMKPVTLNHPNEFVTSENAGELSVGSLGDNPSSGTQIIDWGGQVKDWQKVTDGINCAIDMVITRGDAIDAVVNGKQGLSMGYFCDLEETSGVWCGIEYDCIQRNIRYNHCAIVDAGRAGDNAKIMLRMDSKDAVLEDRYIPNIKTDDGGHKMGMKKITLDGMDYEAEESVIKAFNSEKERADGLAVELEKVKKDSATQISELTADRDTQKERADKFEGEVKALKEAQLDQAKIDEAVKSKLAIIKKAEDAGVEVKEDMSEMDIKKEVILKYYPKANFDGKDDTYINARYDATLETIEIGKEAEARQAFNSDQRTTDSSDKAHSDYVARLKNHGKKEDK